MTTARSTSLVCLTLLAASLAAPLAIAQAPPATPPTAPTPPTPPRTPRIIMDRVRMAEDRARTAFARHPEVHRPHAVAALDDAASEIDLAVELEGTGLNGECPRGGAGLRRPVDEAHRHFQVSEPQGEHQAGGSGPDDEHSGVGHEMPFW